MELDCRDIKDMVYIGHQAYGQGNIYLAGLAFRVSQHLMADTILAAEERVEIERSLCNLACKIGVTPAEMQFVSLL